MRERINCDECNFHTTSKEMLKTHKETFHEETCKQCDFRTTSKDMLKRHTETVHYKCNKCDFQATNTDSLMKHKKSYHEGSRIKMGPKRMHCALCEKKFNKVETFKQHQRTHHNICNICGKTFQSTQELKIHTRSDHKEIYIVEGQV